MHWMKRILPTVCALFMAAASPPGHAFMEGFIDPSDGYLDMSDWLVNKQGFLPVPIVITEPAVGYGGGVALMFVRNSIRESAEKAKETGHLTPPDIWVVGSASGLRRSWPCRRRRRPWCRSRWRRRPPPRCPAA